LICRLIHHQRMAIYQSMNAAQIQANHHEDAPPCLGARSPTRLLRVFETLAQSSKGMTLTELCTTLDSPKSSLLSLLRMLVGVKYLVVDGNRYQLGPAMFQLSMSILAGRSYTSLARVFLEELADQSDETAFLTSINREKKLTIYEDVIESRQAVRYVVDIGTTRPLYASAASQLLLAYQEPEWIEAYLSNGPFKNPVSGKAIDIQSFRKQLEKIRTDGYSVSCSQAVKGAAGIAAPIKNPQGFATHAFLIAAPQDRFKKSLPKLCKLITDVADRASQTLGRSEIR